METDHNSFNVRLFAIFSSFDVNSCSPQFEEALPLISFHSLSQVSSPLLFPVFLSLFVISNIVWPKGLGNYWDLDKTRVKLFPNFTSTPFDYLLISWVTNYVSNQGFDRELYSLKRLELKFGLSFQNFSTAYR